MEKKHTRGIQMRTLKRLTFAASLCLLSLSALPSQAQTPVVQVESIQPTAVYPLPGSLDNLPMFNSNSPEIIDEAGILVSSLPGSENANTPFLNYAFKGDFGVFAHHIVKDEVPGDRLLYLGLLATNLSEKPLRLTLKEGASYMTQPDAIFSRQLPSFAPNPSADLYAGPGDRIATELIAGKAPIQRMEITIPPRSSQIVSSLPVTTDVAILPAINGRSSLMYFHSDAPVHLSYLAAFAHKQGEQFVPPKLEDYQMLLNEHTLAGPREQAPPAYSPEDPPPAGFRYGRVSGISTGVSWSGKLWEGTRILERPNVGQKVGYPISSAYIKRFGTSQNQSGNMLRRNPDSAYQAHGNYGVRYNLEIPLHNTTAQFQTYSIALNQPASINGAGKSAEMRYLYPPNKQPMFRGSVRLRWIDEYNQQQDQLTHLILRDGQESAPLALLTLPPKTNYDVKLNMIYPADASPPQLLTIGRVE